MGHHHQHAHKDLYADRAAFFFDRRGQAAVAFSDPTFIRSDMIVVNRADHSVHAILHESDHLIGHVSPEMAEAMIRGGEVLLAAVHVHGHIVDLYAPVCEARR
ncbi:MAG: hypothetical protein H6862_07045 [Rhodospirillales bacterium]|nr:hypothetical protein [Rhodospirillales bacterium]